MYNRYIPQSDGSHRRCHIPEPQRPRPEPERAPQEPPCPEPPTSPCPGNCPHRNCRPVSPKGRQDACAPGVGKFLKQLLPGDFDTEDLLVVLLLLLMGSDNRQEQNTALLTLALYLFL